MLIGISEKDHITHGREKVIFLNKVKQYILKDVIAKFGFSLKIQDFCLNMIKYRANPIYSFYRIFKKIKVYLGILDTKSTS